jgi:alkylated DNA repair protein alkB family protein 8
MAKSGYTRPPQPLAEDTAERPAPSAVLYVANCGPAVGLTHDDVAAAFGDYGEIEGVSAADDSGARVIVRFREPAAAGAAMAALHGCPCGRLAGRVLHIRYSVPAPAPKVPASVSLPVALSSSELGIPGIHLVEEFVTAAEEQVGELEYCAPLCWLSFSGALLASTPFAGCVIFAPFAGTSCCCG